MSGGAGGGDAGDQGDWRNPDYERQRRWDRLERAEQKRLTRAAARGRRMGDPGEAELVGWLARRQRWPLALNGVGQALLCAVVFAPRWSEGGFFRVLPVLTGLVAVGCAVAFARHTRAVRVNTGRGAAGGGTPGGAGPDRDGRR